MARSKKVFLLIACLWVLIFPSQAQNRYVVHFPDKADARYSVDRPLEFLSQKAIDRRQKSAFQITEDDFPVNQNYLDSLTKYDIPYFYTSRWLNAALVETEENQLNAISDKPFVQSFELVAPNGRYALDPSTENTGYTANDPSSSSHSSDRQLEMLQANKMHEDGYTGSGVSIAVFDGGFKGVNSSSVFGHLFENNQLIYAEDIVSGGKDVFIRDDHGTQVLSCITANYDSQVVGSGYGADISLYITEDTRDEYKIEEYNWVIAAEKADSAGVDIISSSLGYDSFYDDPSMNYSKSELDGKTAVITRGAQMATERGMLVVISSGNVLDLQAWDLISFPADAENVLSVGSVKSDRSKSGFSLGGPTADNRTKPEVAAMGSSAVVINDSGEITTNNGTSFSCPLIAGFAAGLWQAKPELTNIELRQLIIDSSSQSDKPDNLLGYGIPNYNIAMGKILGIEYQNSQKVEIYPNPVTGNILKVKLRQTQFIPEMTLNLYNSNGQVVVSEKRQNLAPNSIMELDLSSQAKGIYILSIAGLKNYKGIKLLKF